MAYAQQVFTYIPNAVTVLIDGYRVTGLLSVKVEKTDATFKVVRGIRGVNTRVKILDESYTITLDLQQVDPVNDFLSDMHIEDTRSGGGTFRLVIGDVSGNTRFYAENAFIEKTPDLTFSNEFENRVWVIKTLSNTGVFLGGNDLSRQSVNLTDIIQR